MSAHIAQAALLGLLPKGACHSCDRNGVRKGHINCRAKQPLNGEEAAAEFSRPLLPSVRARLLGQERAYPVAPIESTTETEAA